MTRLYKLFVNIFVYLYFSFSVFSQNEFYNNGAIVYLNAGSVSTTPTLFINGNITNQDGALTNNNSFLEITGDFTNNPTTYHYISQSGAIERFSGNTEQAIKGTWNGTSANQDQFYNLTIYKTGVTGNNKYLTLHANTNINAAGSIVFETPASNAAIIRTDNAATSPSNPNNYQFILYLQNPSPSSLSGYSALTANGTAPVTSNYIEGKLKRQVNTTSVDYDFPIGLRPDIKDGMEPFSLSFSSLSTSIGILGLIRDASINTIYKNVVCDVGKDPGPGNQQFPSCTGGKDGIFDLYYLDNNLSHEWSVTPDNVASYNYTTTLYPGANLDNLNYYTIPSPCEATYTNKRLRVIAKDGVVGGTMQFGANAYAPFQSVVSYVWCDFDDASLPISLGGQTSFSTYRIHGTSLSTGTALPVELLSFKLEAINNEYIKLIWQTASELNNAGFFLEKSDNGKDFQSIGWIAGQGTTSQLHQYYFDDRNVEKNKTYYYRLKQIDLNQTSKNSFTISGTLIDVNNNSFSILNISPNPTANNSVANIFAPYSGTMQIVIFNLLGQVVQTSSIELTKGNNITSLNIDKLSSSTYIVAFTFNNQTFTKKIIKK